jgi:tRNA pseudouridine55 synthase
MGLGLSEHPVGIGLDGVLIVDKPAGWTSHDVVAKVRKLLGVRKVGHTGTLDPSATGLLVLCLGKGTRIAEYLMLADKAYRATLRLGVATDTQDASGTVVSRHPGPFPEEPAIRAVMEACVGMMHQVPPMYSAIKVKGVPLYKAARAGQIVPRVSRACRIHTLTILSCRRTPTVDVVFDVLCSKGTYVRTLCADIGDTLGVGGHLASLERRQVGRFGLEQALTLDELADAVERKELQAHMHSLADALSELPAFTLDSLASEAARHGTAFSPSRIRSTEGQWSSGAPIRLHGADGRLVGIGKVSWGSDDPVGADPAAVVRIEKVLV